MFVQRRAAGGERLVTSASDLTAASACEFAFLRRVDAKLGRDVEVAPDDDPMLAYAARLGDAHEARTLAAYRERYGVAGAAPFNDDTGTAGVAEIRRPDSMAEPDLEAVAAETLSALAARSPLVFQATFFEPSQRPAAGDDLEIGFVGFADFLELRGSDGYEVQDTKLARRAKVTALMQLAAYAEQLERVGVPVAGDATLILGTGSRSRHRLLDIAPVFRARRARLHQILLCRARATGADGLRASAAPIEWGDPNIAACGRCEVCEPEIERARDPLLIAGIRATQRDAFVEAGFGTIDAVAELAERAEAGGLTSTTGLSAPVAERLIAQAQVQLAAVPGSPPPVRVIGADELAAIPAPSPGDIFFDFEGDPLFREASEATATWGIDYLFGWVDTHEEYQALWAHDLAAERAALLEFLRVVAERRSAHPDMHIYHYAAYERTHLLSIAARHGVGEAEVDDLLREHVLVDLYPIVTRALRVGSRSYSIKKLEPLYMGDELRDQDGVTSGTQSVTEYAEASELMVSQDPAEREAGQRRLDAIADYNRYDCVSTLRLRDWLLGIAVAHGVSPYAAETGSADPVPALQLSAVAARLTAHAAARGDEADSQAERQAIALAGSAIDYHQREQKSYWWAHFARLADPIEDWADTRDVLIVDQNLSRVRENWFLPPRARAERRHVALRGELAPGSSAGVGSEVFAVYAHPAPFPTPGAAPGARGARRVRIIERGDNEIVIEELAPGGVLYDELPLALTPGPPPNAGAQKTAIEEWGAMVADHLDDHFDDHFDDGAFPRDPVTDLLLGSPPRLRGELAVPSGENDTVGAVVDSLQRLDRSYLAVQGPPGTGKTFVAAHVIARLVSEHQWRIGVVAQSHRVVEHVLEAVIGAGLDPHAVGKVPQGGALAEGEAPAFTVLPRDGQRAFQAGHRASGRGYVIGGTAWDFSNLKRFERGGLDLLVIDEAGQFSLAPTIAASVAAERLLLLGDPQQLPQVSQGSHPEPVDTSALGWLLGNAETLPQHLGYFLAESRRMRPELSSVVSELSYDGRLRSHQTASAREVRGAGRPGLIWHPVSHAGNSTSSPEEAAEVISTVEAVLGAEIDDGAEIHEGARRRVLGHDDIIIVAAYNAQVELLSDALFAAGHGRIRVGTVDKFQGQEAVIAIVSLAASTAEDIPRGVEFLLMRNRLNVAISRAQWAAHLVSSDRLGDGLPWTAEGLAALSGYLRLTERGA